MNRLGIVALAAVIVGGGGITSGANAQDVEWTGLVNVAVSGTTLQKISGCDGCDDAGARSQDQIDSPGGYVEFTVGEANTFWIGGLSNGNSSPSYSGIDYAFRFNGAGGADVLQNGVYKGGDTAYAAGDIFRISVAYGRVQFWRNGTVLYTSRTAPTYPLVLDVALGTVGASLYDAKLSHDIVGDPPPPPPPLTTSNITWTDLVNVTVGDRVLQKTAGCGGCADAGARSQEEIQSGDGYIEFTVGEINTFWLAGLSHGNADTSYADIDFAFRFNGAGIADVMENGVYKGGDTTYTVGDVFRVAIVDGQVYYRHNGELVYVSQITPTYPLLLDTAFGTMDATIYNANLVATSPIVGDDDLLPYDGGFFETNGSQQNRLKSDFELSLVPQQKGPFVFLPPYNTQAARLTDPTDCGGSLLSSGPATDCLWYVGYSYWRRMNNHVDSDKIYILLGLETRRGGTGPTLFSYNKTSGAVMNMGPLFDESNDPTGVFKAQDAEMWYFSADRMKPTTLYAFAKTSTQLLRVDVLTEDGRAHARFINVAMDLAACPRSGGPFDCPTDAAYFDHPHSSDDDRVHAANVRRANGDDLGCVVYDETAPEDARFRYFAPEPGRDLDECALDKSGRWLVLRERSPDDALVIDLQTNQITALRDADGAHSPHSDLGHGYSVGPDDHYPPVADQPIPNATTLVRFPADPRHTRGELVHYDRESPNWVINDANHVSHTNADGSLWPEQQYACGSNASHGDHRDEIVCFSLDAYRHNPPDVLVVAPVMTSLDSPTPGSANEPDDYARLPKGHLDVTGEYFIWTTNMYGSRDRLDAFIVKVPKTKLLTH